MVLSYSRRLPLHCVSIFYVRDVTMHTFRPYLDLEVSAAYLKRLEIIAAKQIRRLCLNHNLLRLWYTYMNKVLTPSFVGCTHFFERCYFIHCLESSRLTNKKILNIGRYVITPLILYRESSVNCKSKI